MTVYSVTLNADGVTEQTYDNKNTVTEADAPEIGMTVKDRGGWKRTVSTPDDLRDDDLVNIDGYDVTVATARQLGFSDRLNKQLNKSAEQVEAFMTDGELPVEQGAEQADPKAIAIEKAVEDGLTSHSEINVGQTIAATLEMHANLSADDTAELVADIVKGEIPELDPVWDALREKGIGKEGFKESIAQAQKVSTNEAMRSLGAEGFRELDEIASRSTTVRDLVIKHAMARARGATNVGWTDVLALARQWQSR